MLPHLYAGCRKYWLLLGDFAVSLYSYYYITCTIDQCTASDTCLKDILCHMRSFDPLLVIFTGDLSSLTILRHVTWSRFHFTMFTLVGGLSKVITSVHLIIGKLIKNTGKTIMGLKSNLNITCGHSDDSEAGKSEGQHFCRHHGSLCRKKWYVTLLGFRVEC